MVMEIRKDYRKYFVQPKHCPRCSKWPAAEQKLRMSKVDEFTEGRLCARASWSSLLGFTGIGNCVRRSIGGDNDG